jgi:hypothetical protein
MIGQRTFCGASAWLRTGETSVRRICPGRSFSAVSPVRDRCHEENAIAKGLNRRSLVSILGFATLLCVPRLDGQTPTAGATQTTAAVAQSRSATPGCPGGNGIHISVNSGTSADSSSGINTVIDERRSLDTTIVFNVAQKTWTRTNLAAAITAGLADQARGGYAICAGVTAMMPSATLTINGARGRVHFAATLQNLLNAIRLGPGAASPQPRRL